MEYLLTAMPDISASVLKNLAQKIILFWIIYPSLPGMTPTYCPNGSGYFPLIRHTQQLGTTRLFPAPK
jgi:hypothetical protein